jgi:hypothetical protein
VPDVPQRCRPISALTAAMIASSWHVLETEPCFIVRDQNGQTLAYVYCEDDPGRRAAANLLTRDETRRIAAKLPELCGNEKGRPTGRRPCMRHLKSRTGTPDLRLCSTSMCVPNTRSPIPIAMDPSKRPRLASSRATIVWRLITLFRPLRSGEPANARLGAVSCHGAVGARQLSLEVASQRHSGEGSPAGRRSPQNPKFKSALSVPGCAVRGSDRGVTYLWMQEMR